MGAVLKLQAYWASHAFTDCVHLQCCKEVGSGVLIQGEVGPSEVHVHHGKQVLQVEGDTEGDEPTHQAMQCYRVRSQGRACTLCHANGATYLVSNLGATVDPQEVLDQVVFCSNGRVAITCRQWPSGRAACTLASLCAHVRPSVRHASALCARTLTQQTEERRQVRSDLPLLGFASSGTARLGHQRLLKSAGDERHRTISQRTRVHA